MAREKGIPEKYVDDVEKKFQYDNNSTKIARTIGLLLRHGVKIKNIVAEIDKIEGVTFASFLFHIKKLLSSYIKTGEIVTGVLCSNCGGKLIYESGCQRCLQCASSKCG
jgi:ribonucleoside-diphosphate reductase alpha chain